MAAMLWCLSIIATIALAAFAGWAYRDGGSASGIGRWIRQAGMMVAMFLGLWLWFGWTPWIGLSAGLCWAESTYFKKKGTDATFVNWLLVGAVFWLIPLPVVWATGKHWPWFWWTALMIPIVGIWCKFMTGFLKADSWSEGGRGAIQLLRFLLLYLPFL